MWQRQGLGIPWSSAWPCCMHCFVENFPARKTSLKTWGTEWCSPWSTVPLNILGGKSTGSESKVLPCLAWPAATLWCWWPWEGYSKILILSVFVCCWSNIFNNIKLYLLVSHSCTCQDDKWHCFPAAAGGKKKILLSIWWAFLAGSHWACVLLPAGASPGDPGDRGSKGAPARVRVHRGPSIHLGLRPGRGEAHGTVRGPEREAVPHPAHAEGAEELPVWFPSPPAQPVQLLHQAGGAVHKGTSGRVITLGRNEFGGLMKPGWK